MTTAQFPSATVSASDNRNNRFYYYILFLIEKIVYSKGLISRRLSSTPAAVHMVVAVTPESGSYGKKNNNQKTINTPQL